MGNGTSLNDRSSGKFVALWAALLLLALALRVTLVMQYQVQHPSAQALSIDEAAYASWASEIAGGAWLGDEVFFQEPLYPYWLATIYATVGESLYAVRLVQCVVGCLSVALIGLLATRLFGRAAGLWAGLAAALYKPLLLAPALILKPNLVVPCIAGLALLLTTRAPARPRLHWLACGVLAGVGALLRGNLLILIPAFCLWPSARALFLETERGRALRASGLIALGVALVLLPVALRNWSVGGVFALTTSGAGTNVYGGNNAQNPYGVASEFDWVRGIPRYEADDWRREAERRTGRALDPGEVSSYWLGETLSSMSDDPALHARIFWNKARLALGAFEVPDNHYLPWDARYVPILRLPTGGFGWWGLFGLAGLFAALAQIRGRRTLGPEIELSLLFALYWSTIVLTVLTMRARLGLVPLLLPFAGAAIAGLRRPRAGLAVRVAALALAALCVWLPVFDAGQHERELAERDFNHAVQLSRAGEWTAALAIARALDDRYPGTSRVHTLLAAGEFEAARRQVRAGDVVAGRAAMLAALERVERVAADESIARRERFRAASLAGRIAFVVGDAARAVHQLSAARRFDAEDPDLVCDLAQALRARDGRAGLQRPEWSELEQDLETAAAAGSMRARVLLSGVQSERALERLRAGASADSAADQAIVQEALQRLRAVCEDSSVSAAVLYAARLTAARIQSDPLLASDRAARNHLQAALALRPGAFEARRLLGFIEWSLAEGDSARRAALSDLRQLAEELDDSALREQVRALESEL